MEVDWTEVFHWAEHYMIDNHPEQAGPCSYCGYWPY